MIAKVKKTIKNTLLEILIPTGFYYKSGGYCPCCEKDVIFHTVTPDLRERYKCLNCKSSPRERAVMLAIQKYFPNWKNLSIHESSPENRGVSLKLKTECSNYIASQFYPNNKFGEIVDGYRNENLESLTFQNEAFDIVVTQDVMEHVYNPEKAFKEIERTLRKGGAHIFTIPVINMHLPTETWATLGSNGKPVFLKTPEYHGNPVSNEGSPVTMHWGYDIVKHIENWCNMHTTIENVDNNKNGVMGYIDVFVSFKN